jgi:hypothetical protein
MPTIPVHFPSASIILINKPKISSLKMVIYHQKQNGRVKLEWGVKTIPLVSICMTWRDSMSTINTHNQSLISLDYEKFRQNEDRNDFKTEFEHRFAERTRFTNPRREAKKQKMNEDIDQQETDDKDEQETDHEDQQDEQEIEDMNGKEGNEE